MCIIRLMEHVVFFLGLVKRLPRKWTYIFYATLVRIVRQILGAMVHWQVDGFTVNRVLEMSFVRVVWQILRTMVHRQVGWFTVMTIVCWQVFGTMVNWKVGRFTVNRWFSR
jgi:hypothetical protein